MIGCFTTSPPANQTTAEQPSSEKPNMEPTMEQVAAEQEMTSPCYPLSNKNDIRVVQGRWVEFAIKPTREGTEDMEPTRVQFSLLYWKKLKEQMGAVSQKLKSRSQGKVQIYKTKYVEVKENFGCWWANLLSYTRKGQVINPASVWLRECEWNNLMLVEKRITKHLQDGQLATQVQRNREKQERKEANRKAAVLYQWRCGDTCSVEEFFSKETAERNALADPDVYRQRDLLVLETVSREMPCVATIVRFAYMFLLNYLGNKTFEAEKDKHPTKEAAYNATEVPPVWIKAMYCHFHRSAGVALSCLENSSECEATLHSLLSFVTKDQLVMEALQLQPDYSAKYLLCEEALSSIIADGTTS